MQRKIRTEYYSVRRAQSNEWSGAMIIRASVSQIPWHDSQGNPWCAVIQTNGTTNVVMNC